MTRINEDLVVQYVEGETPSSDLIVVVHDPSGTEFTIDFAEAGRLHDALAYFENAHRDAVFGAEK